jgi:hypothetical protein
MPAPERDRGQARQEVEEITGNRIMAQNDSDKTVKVKLVKGPRHPARHRLSVKALGLQA